MAQVGLGDSATLLHSWMPLGEKSYTAAEGLKGAKGAEETSAQHEQYKLKDQGTSQESKCIM